MENEYYIPNIGDIHIGYECEIKVPLFDGSEWSSPEYTKGMVTGIFPNFEWTDFREIPHTFSSDIKLDIRTPFLYKEQIESEDWKFETDNNDIHTFLKGRNRLIYSYFSRILWLDDAIRGGQIAGGVKCLSINEFRKIFKLLSF